MAAFPLERFEARAEAFLRQRARRVWAHQIGLSAGLGLATLYERDFPELSSYELYADLLDAQVEDSTRKGSLVALLSAAHLEARTADFAERVARFEATATVTLDERDIPWRAAPVPWTLSSSVERRHQLQGAWRERVREDLLPTLHRWWEALVAAAARLPGGPTWPWGKGDAADQPYPGLADQATALLAATDTLYASGLRALLALHELPLDDAWPADVDSVLRATRFDTLFPPRDLLPGVARLLRDLGVEVAEQAGLRLDLEERPTRAPGVRVVPLEPSGEVGVSLRLVGGYQDARRLVQGVGQAQHLLWTDRALPMAQRWLGDATTTRAYGEVLAAILLDPVWLRERRGADDSHDLRVIGHLAWLRRIRGTAALLLHEQALWADGPQRGGLGTDFAERLSAATRSRHHADEALLPLARGPWGPLDSALDLRAHLLAAHVRHYLRQEYDEEWWRNARAGRFLVQELWRPGRRYTAEQLLGFMGYAGFDVRLLCADFEDVLRSV